VKEPISVGDGYASLTDKPGLGVDLIEPDFQKLAGKFPI
jgi:L-alanine-DL-glutamate epimerase-like enolase superfamily enzyme